MSFFDKPIRANFTHEGTFYGVPIYFNEDTGNLAGKNWLCDLLVIPLPHIHNYFIAPFSENVGFPMRLMPIEQN